MRGILLRRKRTWLLGGALLALILGVGGFLGIKRASRASAADDPDPIFSANAIIRSDGDDYSYGEVTNYFRLEGAGINTAWCAQANKKTPPLNTSTSVAVYDMSNAPSSFQTWFKILWYGNERYLANEQGYAYTNMEIHFALSRAYAGTAGTSISDQTLRSRSWKLYQDAAAAAMPSGTNYLYIAYNSNGSQTLMTYYHWDISYVDLDVTKVWVDSDDKYNTRPESISVELLKDGVGTGKHVTLTKKNGWSGSFTELEEGPSYSVSEQAVNNYSGNYFCSQDDSLNWHCTITNSLTKEFINLPVKKVWRDDDNANLSRPAYIRVYLIKGGVKQQNKYIDLSEKNNWSGSFNDLEKGPIYSVTEQDPVSDVYDYVGNVNCSNGSCVITNTLTGTRDIPVTKVWNDHGQVDNRPEYITVVLSGDDGSTRTYTIRPSEDEDKGDPNTWKKTFNVPRYNQQGVEIVYSVSEILPDGTDYQLDSTTGNMYGDGFTITNSYEEKTRLFVQKTWVDDGNRNPESRPVSVTIRLYQNNTNSPVYREVVLTAANAHQITETEAATMSVEQLTRLANTWEMSFEDLPKYDANDRLINWIVDEEVVTGYDNNIICTDTDRVYGNDVCTITNTRYGEVSINVDKTWVDGNNADGKRPSSVKFLILQQYYNYSGSGMLVRQYGDFTVYASDDWSATIPKLPRYDEKGREFIYFVAEVPSGPYESNKTGESRDENGNYYFEYENTRTILTNISMEKCWVDGNNRRGYRPESLNFVLTTTLTDKDNPDNVLSTETEDIELTGEADAKCWTDSIENLPMFDENDNVYHYSVEEDTSWMDGTDYVTEDSVCDTDEDGWACEFLNKLDGETTLTGTKTWLDDKNAKVLRPNPDSFEVILYRTADDHDEETLNIQPSWVSSNDGQTWTYTYENLPRFDEEGFQYRYRVEEKEAEIDLANGDKYVSREMTNNFVNVLTGSIDYCGKKVWIDQDAPEGFRPESIVVTLTRDDGTTYTTTVSASSSEEALELCGEEISTEYEVWYFKFEDLDKYDNDGGEYDYTLSENSDIANYVTTIAQSTGTIINDYEIKPINLTVNKYWLNDKEDDRPKSIKVTLYRNGKVYDMVELSDKEGWTHTWDRLDGNYKWTITEDIQIEYYGTEIRYEEDDDGNIVVNIYNTKTPDTRDKGISRYVFIMSGILLSGIFVSKKAFARN